MFDEDIKRYSNELWVSLEEFEKQIKEEEKGYKMELNLQKKRYEAQLHRLRSLYLFES